MDPKLYNRILRLVLLVVRSKDFWYGMSNFSDFYVCRKLNVLINYFRNVLDHCNFSLLVIPNYFTEVTCFIMLVSMVYVETVGWSLLVILRNSHLSKLKGSSFGPLWTILLVSSKFYSNPQWSWRPTQKVLGQIAVKLFMSFWRRVQSS